MTMLPASKSSRKEDPDGSGSRAPSAISAATAAPSNPSNGTTTTNASSSEQTFKKGKGKSSKNLAMLSIYPHTFNTCIVRLSDASV